MKIAYVDDSQEELNTLRGYIRQALPPETVFDVFRNQEDFAAVWSAGKYDLILLDIYLENGLGVELAREIRKTDSAVALAFCTTSNEFASESYEVNARYYLQKPFTAEKVRTLLSRLNMEDIERVRTATLPDGQSLMLRNVIYTEYSAHVVIIHCSRQEQVRTRISQAELESILCAYSFFESCTKGIVVNLYEIERLDQDCFVMKNGARIPISRRKLKEITERYNAFRFENLRKGGTP